MAPVVRAAEFDEAEQIRRLMRKVIEASVDRALQPDIIANVEANLEAWLGRSVEGVHLVAVSGRSIVGVVMVKHFWNLCSLFVEPSRQHAGIGRSLVEAAAIACASRSPKQALVLNAYPDAVGFYERLGFTRRSSNQVLPHGIQPMERALYPNPKMPTYEITSDKSRMSVGAAHAFLSEAYWSPGVPLSTVQRAFDNSLCFAALANGEQVAFARVVTDRATFAYLADVYVLPEHRGQGLARQLVEAVQRHPDLQGLRRFMLATRDAHQLYAKFGFTPLAAPDRFMERHDPDVYARGV